MREATNARNGCSLQAKVDYCEAVEISSEAIYYLYRYWDPLLVKVEPPADRNNMYLHSVTCKLCNAPFPSEEEMKDHLYNFGLNLYMCCRCGSNFVDEKTFRIHLRDHMRISTWIPTLSRITTGRMVDSRIHNVFVCKYCDGTFSDRADFFKHYMEHTKSPLSVFVCGGCDHKFKTEAGLHKHKCNEQNHRQVATILKRKRR